MVPVWRRAAGRLNGQVLVGAGALLALALVAWLAPYLAPHGPNDQDLLATLLPPAWAPGGDPAYPLGTDALGQCILSRLIYSARVTVIIATSAPLGAALVGTAAALLAGYCGGRIDWLVMRLVDVWLSFPAIVMALVLMVALGPSIGSVIVAIVLVDWTRFCRVVRSEVLVARQRSYIPAARIAGARHHSVLWRDIVPGLVPTLIALVGIEIGVAVIAESVLSFVGVSVQADVPTWGRMLADGLADVFSAPIGLIAPMLCMVGTVFAASLLGEGLRHLNDAYKQRQGGAA
ncbi:ABC transporter permease [Verticiella sediminum]|uniref:ABC transporter permease n=1 Tax=Verticiella sediminum TaxID=1247510 RepID=A0A556AXK1_9BURK|nr:ABC transporter permease [Verticiella sediminum]